MGSAIAVDAVGNVYVTGQTNSTDFPTANPLQARSGGRYDAFVAKLNATGSVLVYSTYLGGIDDDAGSAVAVDSAGNAYVTGYTHSTNFPTASPLPRPLGGVWPNAFVTKLNPAGSALVYSTYLGNVDSAGFGIALDSAGNAYITGYTRASNFPTVSPVQAIWGGNSDAFVTKLNPTGSALVYSTYLGGSGDDGGYGIALDSAGNAYVTGTTSSTNFPIVNPLQSTSTGGTGGFVAKLNPAGSALIYSTYLASRRGRIAVDSAGNAYVTGETSLPCIELPPSAGTGVSVIKLNATGAAVIYSACMGGSGRDDGGGIAVDAAGNAYVTGTTSSANFPTVNPLQVRFGGDHDAFVAKLSSNAPIVGLSATSLTFGNQAVGATSVAQSLTVANSGTAALNVRGIAIAGTNSRDFAQTNTCGTVVAEGASCTISVTFAPTAGGTRTATVTITDDAGDSQQMISLSGVGTAPTVTLSTASLTFGYQTVGTVSSAQTVTLRNSGTAPLNVVAIAVPGNNSADFAQSNTCGTVVAEGASCTISVTFAPTAGGTRAATVTITDDAGNSPQTISVTGVGTLSPVPVLPSGGIVNAASNQPVLAAGSIATAYGLNLGDTASAATPTLPTQLGNTRILFPDFGNLAAPLFYVSPGQVNFQIPWELSNSTQTRIIASVNAVPSQPQTIALTSAAPGIFILTGTQGAITDAFTGVVAAAPGTVPGAASSPVLRGGYVSIYCNALGIVGNRPGTGAPGPSAPTLAQVVARVQVSIAGVLANAQFAGLAPGLVGVYQVNALIPTNVPIGDAIPVFLRVGDATSNVVTIAIQ